VDSDEKFTLGQTSLAEVIIVTRIGLGRQMPATSKGLRKMAAKIFEHTSANQSLMFYAL